MANPILAGLSGVGDMAIGGLSEGFNAIMRGAAAAGLGAKTGELRGQLDNGGSAYNRQVGRNNRKADARMGELYSSTVGNSSNPFFQMSPGGYTGPGFTLPTAPGQGGGGFGIHSDAARENYGTIAQQGRNDINRIEAQRSEAIAGVKQYGDAAIKDIVDTTGAGISGFSASAKEQIDAYSQDLDSKVASGEIPPAAAEQLKSQAKLQAGAGMRDSARQMIGDRATKLAETRLATAGQLASTMTSFGSTLSGQMQNYLGQLNTAGGMVQEGLRLDADTAHQMAKWSADIIDYDRTLANETALTTYQTLVDAVALEMSGARDTASLLAGVQLNAQNMAGFSSTYGNVANAQASNQSNEDSGWF